MADAFPRGERPAKAMGTAALVVGRYTLAATAVAAAGGATLIIRHLTDSPTFFAFYAAIFFSIWFAGRGPGLVSLVLSSIAAHVLFHVTASPDPVTREVPTLLALLTCTVIADTLSAHRHRGEAALRAASELLEAKVEERTSDLKRANEELIREVADRKRAQAALQVAEERWRRLYEASAAGMALARSDGVFTGANPAFQKMLDLTEDEIKGRTAVEITHPGERAATVDMIADFKSGAMQEYHAEKRYLRRDGKPVWVNVTTTLVPALDESGPSLQAVYVDITERKRAEEALRASEERWRRTFESSAVPMALADANRRIVAVNPACERLLGYSHEEFMTMSALDFKYGDDRGVSAQALAELEQGLRSAFQSELCFRHKDGTMIWVHVSVSYVPATEVTPALFPAIIEDITQRKQAELERERLALVVEKSGEAMGICNLDGIPLYLNKAGLRLVGFDSMDELRERKGTHYVFPEDRPFINTVLWPSVLNKGSWSGEIRFRHFKTGKAVPVLYDGFRIDEQYTGVVCRDITERKQAEAALRAGEARFRAIFETSMVGMTTSDVGGTYTSGNRAFQRMVGYSEEELRAFGPLDLTHEEDCPLTRELMSDLVAGRRRDYQIEKRYRRKDGEPIWASVYASFVPSADDAPAFYCAVVVDITERKRAELERRRLASMVEQSGDLMAIADLEGNPDYVNEAGLRMVGLNSMDELRDRRGTHFLFREDRKFMSEAIWPSVMQRGTWSGEFRLRHFKTHEEIPVLYDTFRLDDPETGHPTATGFVCRDISDRRRAEAALRASETRWRRLFETSAAGMALATIDGRYMATNLAFQRMLGYSDQELRDRTAIDITHPDDRTVAEQALAEFGDGARQDYRRDKRFVRKDGTPLWVNVTVSLVPESELTPPLLQAVYIDIDDRKRVETALRVSEERWRTVFQMAPVGIATVDLDNRIVTANPALQRMLGYDEEELRTLRGIDITHEDDRALTRSLIDDVAAGRRHSYQLEKRYRRKDGRTIWANANTALVPATESTEAFYAGVVLDMTDRRRAEEALRHAQAELARVARMTVVGELGASIAHEINQPLAAIVASGNACRRWLANGQNLARATESVERIISDANRASEVIKRIRAMTRKKAPERGRVEINNTIEEVLLLVASELQAKHVSVRKAMSAQLPDVMADRVQLQQVLLNLILNGLDAMAVISDRRRELVIGTRLEDGGYVTVMVQDTGTGLDPTLADRVFEAFVTTKVDGMGMGLSISASIVEAHGGRLWSSPAVPHGTAFYFTVPVVSCADGI